MAIKTNATTVISNTPNIDFAQLKNHSQIVTTLNNVNCVGGPWPASDVSYNPANFTLSITYDNNCACDCACVQCMCDCTPGG